MTEDYNGKYLDIKAWRLVSEIPKGHRRIRGKRLRRQQVQLLYQTSGIVEIHDVATACQRWS